jgi:catechol 2,3-dioxygenase
MKPLKLGHVHIKVRDLDRSIEFYQSLIGLSVTERVASLAFLSDGQAHHTLALQALGSAAESPSMNQVGLYHVAFEVETDEEFQQAVALARSFTHVATVDHGISWAAYLNDPDGNGVEIYVDRRSKADGRPLWQPVALN